MRKKFLGVLFFIFVCVQPLFAQALNTITLKDGSIVKGSVLKLENHVYTVKTDNLGEININDTDVLTISNTSSPSIQQNLPQINQIQTNDQFKNLQNTLLSDNEIKGDMQELLKDPEVISILSDPQLIQDVLSQDPQKITNNSKIKTLLENPQMKELLLKASQKLNSQQ